MFKALGDPTRRGLLDALFEEDGQTLGALEARVDMTRFGVMKHLDGLRDAGLVNTREDGRQRWNSLNVFPIRQIYERWVSPYQEMWASQLLGIKQLAEEESAEEPHTGDAVAGVSKKRKSKRE